MTTHTPGMHRPAPAPAPTDAQVLQRLRWGVCLDCGKPAYFKLDNHSLCEICGGRNVAGT